MNQRWVRTSIIYLLIAVAVVAIFLMVLRSPSGGTDVEITKIIALAKDGKLKQITVDNDNVTAETTGGEKLKSRKESGISVAQMLSNEKVPITGDNAVLVKVKSSSSLSNVFGLLLNFLPLIFFGAIILFMMRQAQGTNSQAMSFGRSRAKMFIGNKPAVSFSDVAGVAEAKEELQEVVEFLKYPERFSTLGARIPRGVLLVGPPGTGKTLLARAVAGEAGVPFFHISGSEFVEMFVGVGASRVRDLFDQAKRNAPCIIFIDEIDAVGRHRGAGLGGGHDEREQTLNQILVEMDGFDQSVNIIVIAATNRPDILDPALLRPGRFDRRVVLDTPDIAGRKAILGVHSKGKPLDTTVDLDVIAKQTPGFSGADLANVINEGAILTARRNKKTIGMSELEEAADRVIAGPERRSRVISLRQKEVTAYHEAGHALVAHSLEHADPVHKISIVSRGNMGGYTRLLPAEDRFLYSRNQFLDMLTVSLGGRASEQIVFGDITTGASNDLENATRLARRMVTEYGMASGLDVEVENIPISTVIFMAKAGKVKAIEVFGEDLLITLPEDVARAMAGTAGVAGPNGDGALAASARPKARKMFRSRKEPDSGLLEVLARAGVTTGPDGVDVQVKSSRGLPVGPRTYGQRQELVFLGREISEQRDYGDKTAEEIDEEIGRLVDGANRRALDILSSKRERLDQLAQRLIAKETLEGKELAELLPPRTPPQEAKEAPAAGPPKEPSATA